jgi:hypothetical protein
MTTALEHLKALREAARFIHPSETGEWIAAAIDAYIASGGKSSLEGLLGLMGRGIRKPGTQEAMTKRDAALLDAYNLLPVIESESDTTRLERLANAIRNFEANKLPRLTGVPESRMQLSMMDSALLKAFNAAPTSSFPRTTSALRKRLLNTPAIHSKPPSAHCIITEKEDG